MHKKSASKHNVRGFPTIKVFKNGAVLQDYKVSTQDTIRKAASGSKGCGLSGRLIYDWGCFTPLTGWWLQGGRTAEDLVNFMVTKSGPALVTLKSKADAEAFIAKHAAVSPTPMIDQWGAWMNSVHHPMQPSSGHCLQPGKRPCRAVYLEPSKS